MSLTALFDPTQLILEVSESHKQSAWQQSQSAATPNTRWQTYLNRVCLSVFLPWLREEENPRAQVWSGNGSLPSFWELTNGAAITLGNKRLVLIPSETTDLGELRVPQEWVDIADWAADYYLAVQVNLDDNYIRVWGYCTHKQLKTTGNYSSSDRTYVLDEEALITDLDVLWVAQELCPDEVTKVAVEPLTEMATTQAENLIQRLGDAEIVVPRLAIPFTFWAALIQNNTWRDRLAKKRRGELQQIPVVQWLQAGISNLASELTWRQIEFQPSFVGARDAVSETVTKIGLAKQLTIAGQSYELQILPLERDGEEIWRFELRSLAMGGAIPVGFKLRLLTEELQAFEGNEDIAKTPVDKLCLEVTLESGEGIVWEVEPTPVNYERETLRF